jgi:hypothetical protein
MEGDADAEAPAEGDAEAEGDADGEREVDADAEGEAAGDADADAVDEGEADGTGVLTIVGLALGDGDGEGDSRQIWPMKGDCSFWKLLPLKLSATVDPICDGGDASA